MRLLIGGSSSKLFHLKEFAKNLEEKGITCKVILDSDYADGFPSRKVKNWFNSNKKFKNLIEEFKPDIIFVDRTRHFALEASKTNIPLVIHLRGDHWAEMIMAKETLYKSAGKKIAINKWDEIGEICFNDSKMIFPICNYLSEVTKKRYKKKSIETMYQGINSDNWFQKKGMELKHPCVGILQSATIWEKTKELMILPEILEKMPNVEFYWAGDGVYRDKILPLLEKYENFHWLGSLEYPDKVREFLTEIDVYTLISGIDMSPLTLQEAQLMEKPVIATDVGGDKEMMVDGKTGFLVKEGNSNDIVEKLTKLLEDEQISEKFGREGAKFVREKFNWEIVAKNFLDIIKPYLKK